ncbi:MAG TPA: lipid-A-disaccharide synthase, partial [Leptospiraceae bacterium]|nr:lipid-A-disaccharide synthase [Leptospiraceae bacterium]
MQKKKSKPTSKKKIIPKKTPTKTKISTKKKILEQDISISEPRKRIEEKILIVCGEPSGDLLGADLMVELRNTKGNFSFTGIGGLEMGKLGFTSLYDIEDLSVMGFTGIFKSYFKLKKIAKNLVEKAIIENVHYAVLIDYPGFNLYLAERLREKGIKVIFYVSPQIWAWRFKRIFKIKKFVNLMLVLFPFEKKIYDEYGVKCEFVGHPLRNRMEEKMKSEKPVQIDKGITTICLMPGSRGVEIDRLLDPILDGAVLIWERYKNLNKKVQFILPNINQSKELLIQEKLKSLKDEKGIDIQYFFDRSAKSIEASDLVILSSGTATLEVTFFEKPMIILYK